MEWRIGGRFVRDTLKTLRTELEDHLGSINELKNGLRKDVLPKPETLRRYELVKSTGLPLIAGGLLDQPHIWIMQWEVIEAVLEIFKAQEEMARQMSAPKDLMAPLRLGQQ